MRLTGERIGREKAQKEFEEKLKEQVGKMLKLNIPINQISEITGLTSDDINQISNN